MGWFTWWPIARCIATTSPAPPTLPPCAACACVDMLSCGAETVLAPPSAEADAGDAAVGVHALAPAGLRGVMPEAVGPRRGDLVLVRFVPLPAVPTARRGLTARTIPARRRSRRTASRRTHHRHRSSPSRTCAPWRPVRGRARPGVPPAARPTFSSVRFPNGSPNAGADCVEDAGHTVFARLHRPGRA